MPSVQIHPKERERIDSCSERFRPLAWQLYREINDMCATENCSPLVVYGFRSASEQLAIWSHGRELIGPGLDIMHASSWRLTADPSDKILTRAFPGQSAHNTGDAVDIALVEGIGATRHWIMDPGVPTPRLFSIRNKVSGQCMGAWHAPTIEAALDMLAKAAGYRDHAHANSVVGGADDLEVVEIRPLASDAPREARDVWARSLGFYSWDAYAHDIECQLIDASHKGDRWHRIVGSAAKRLGLKWGGEFSFFDGAHVQHPEWTIKDRRV